MAELLLFSLALCCGISFVSALVSCWHLYQSGKRQAKITEYHRNVQTKKLTPEEAFRKASL